MAELRKFLGIPDAGDGVVFCSECPGATVTGIAAAAFDARAYLCMHATEQTHVHAQGHA
jgi:hypothetical protein